ncbi:gamma-glutamyltransferase family protein [Maribacter polysaccharolyticus]|uniref:gamma-glutamyltransferase family protein n=1 Tax=Maribacter polysaccharolyticus TaxID=3020831 RepID=UPI00237F2391|nr:gamma-glutamyltransferase [Maribacter polysaccharolyticus]MDE3742503.1 gamma-glutamyltransferase [Maribacter polysaccharolyticus]
MKLFKIVLAVLFLASTSCKNKSEKTVQTIDDGDAQFATSQNGMVAAAQPLATQAGLEMLEAGGNAADAALATAFALAVVEPTMNGIGGRNLVLVRTKEGTFQGYNGMTEIPISYVAPETPVKSGHKTIATPGVVASLMRLYKEHGSLPLSQIMAPSIKYASNGFEVLPGEAIRQKMALPDIKNDPGFKKQMLKNDSIPYEAGEILKQPDLAKTLQGISDSEGADFYQGSIAEKIASDMETNGGYISLEDLKNYKATDMRYVTTDYRGYKIHSMPAPSGGGLLIKTLNILEQFDLTHINDVQWAAIMNQALAISLNSMKDDYTERDLARVQSKEWAKDQATSIEVPEMESSMAAYDYRSFESTDLLADNTDWSGNTWGTDSHHTTHFVTSDCSGMVVSITQTVGPLFGSKVITPGLGFVYASTMGSYLSDSDQAPGSRPRTTIAPTIVTKDGETVMVLGAAGGIRILSGIAQTISRYIDRNLGIKEAVSAPRIHPGKSVIEETGESLFDGKKFSAEFTPNNGWVAADSIAWSKAHFQAKPIERYGAFARVHAVTFDPESRTWTGVADPDWEGTAEGPMKSDCEF